MDFIELFKENTILQYILVFVFVVISILFIRVIFLQKEKKSLNVNLKNNHNQLLDFFNIVEDAIVVLSPQFKITYANALMVKLLNLPKEYQDTALVMPQVKVNKEWVSLETLIKKCRENQIEKYPQLNILVEESSRKSLYVNLYIHTITDEVTNQKSIKIVLHDITKEKEKEVLRFRHKITQLPNHAQALNDLNALYAKLHIDEQKIAIVLMNIDNFSTLRSIIGYEQTNLLLIKFANYLTELSKKLNFTVYHTAHNNFLLTFSHIESSEKIVEYVTRIQEKLVTFYNIEENGLYLTTSAGIALYPDQSTTLLLLDNAYKALEQAEKGGYGRIVVYKKEGIGHDYDELKLYNDMHYAIERNELEVYYQPIIENKSKEIVAAEALIRWHHPEHGMISPEIFIPMMEKTGMIVDLGIYVLNEVLKQLKRWEIFKFKPVEVSINMSLSEIEKEGFVENVSQNLSNHNVSPHLIKFEITEGEAMQNESKSESKLHALKNLGVGISLDDFGTGYTSFSYLKKFPANILKIDKSLVDHILENQEEQRIIRAMIELGHNLGMKIVIEGIENLEMVELLDSYGCDYMQGYYFAKPLPAHEFQEMIRK